MVDGLAVDGKTSSPVGHDTLPLSRPDGGAQIGLGALAEDAVRLLALWGVAGNHLNRAVVVSDIHATQQAVVGVAPRPLVACC